MYRFHENPGFLLMAAASALYVAFVALSLKMIKNDTKDTDANDLKLISYSYYFFAIASLIVPVFVDLMFLYKPTESIRKYIMSRFTGQAVTDTTDAGSSRNYDNDDSSDNSD